VFAYVDFTDPGSKVLGIVIRNDGQSAVTDVKIVEFSLEIDSLNLDKSFGSSSVSMSVDLKLNIKFSGLPPLQGCRVLGPGQKQVAPIGHSQESPDITFPDIAKLTVYFVDAQGGCWERTGFDEPRQVPARIGQRADQIATALTH
jgi:hypothetical protein